MATPAPSGASQTFGQRLASIDAYRGFVMFLMLAEALSFGKVAELLPNSGFWSFLDTQQSHVDWVGCVLHDLIQPSFSFLVGTAMAFSIASRGSRGQSWSQMLRHALGRSLALVFLGIFLRSTHHKQTYYTFEDTLSQIGLGYTFLFLIASRSTRFHWGSVGALLFGYWLCFALYPLPGPDFDWSQAGVAKDWAHHLQGFAAHWNKNTNAAWAFDRWFLNLFSRETPFLYNGGGYSTLSFIPTLGTMVLGLIAGGWLRQASPSSDKLKKLVVAGIGGLFLGLLLDKLGLCPNVKRIWTPSWTLFSGGWCFLLLAGFYALIDVQGKKAWAFPLTVIGMNSIAAYCMDHLFGSFLRRSLEIHLSPQLFSLLGNAYVPFIKGALLLTLFWLILLWMYRRKIFLKL